MSTIRTRNYALALAAASAVLAAALLCQSPASAALVHHWKLDETHGAVADDAQGNRDGTLVNAPTWVPAGGKIDGALDFEAGNNQYVTVGNNLLGNTFTISLWFKLESIPGTGSVQTIFSDFNGTDAGRFLLIVENRSEKAKVVMYQGGGPGSVYGTTSLSLDTWYHLACVKNDSAGFVYLNGQTEITSNMINMPAGTTESVIGSRLSDGVQDRPFDGLVDDVRVYDNALTKEDVLSLFNQPEAIVPEPESLALLIMGLLCAGLHTPRKWW